MKRLYFVMGGCLAAALALLLGGDWYLVVLGAIGAALMGGGVYRWGALLAHGGFALLILAAALSTWNGEQSLALLTSVCASLAAWDIASYLLLLRRVGAKAEPRLIRHRFVRLAAAVGSGWVLGAFALALRMRWGFVAILALALFVILGLTLSMLYMRRQDENVL